MKCPNCGLTNPDEALRCDCGYDFVRKENTQAIQSGTGSEKEGGSANSQYKVFRWIMFGLAILSFSFTQQMPFGPVGKGVGTGLGVFFLLIAMRMGWPRVG